MHRDLSPASASGRADPDQSDFSNWFCLGSCSRVLDSTWHWHSFTRSWELWLCTPSIHVASIWCRYPRSWTCCLVHSSFNPCSCSCNEISAGSSWLVSWYSCSLDWRRTWSRGHHQDLYQEWLPLILDSFWYWTPADSLVSWILSLASLCRLLWQLPLFCNYYSVHQCETEDPIIYLSQTHRPSYSYQSLISISWQTRFRLPPLSGWSWKHF